MPKMRRHIFKRTMDMVWITLLGVAIFAVSLALGGASISWPWK